MTERAKTVYFCQSLLRGGLLNYEEDKDVEALLKGLKMILAQLDVLAGVLSLEESE